MRYSPNYSGQDANVAQELLTISQVLNAVAENIVDVSYHPPDKPRKGMTRYADGTEWDPGAGGGLYYYTGSVWVSVFGGGGGVPDALNIAYFDGLDATYYFYGGWDASVDWKINRYLKTNLVTKTSADEAGNPTYTTLLDAWTDRTTLSYS